MNESSGTPYGEDDKEADNIYDSVDEFMEGRKKRKREEQLLEEARNKARTERPKIADQFADLKQDLAMVSFRPVPRMCDVCIFRRPSYVVLHQSMLSSYLSPFLTTNRHFCPYTNTIPYQRTLFFLTGHCRAMGCYSRNRRPHP